MDQPGASIEGRGKSNLPYRMACGSIILGSMFLFIEYSAIYTSQVAVPHYKVLANSIEDVAANPDIKVYVLKDSPTANYIEVNN